MSTLRHGKGVHCFGASCEPITVRIFPASSIARMFAPSAKYTTPSLSIAIPAKTVSWQNIHFRTMFTPYLNGNDKSINKWSKQLDKKAASPLHMDGSVVFARWRQCAPASNTFPWTFPSPYPKRHVDQFSHFCTAHSLRSLHFTAGPFPSKLPLFMGISRPV